MNLMSLAFRLWRTVRHLRWVQIYGRLRFKVLRPKPQLGVAPKRRSILLHWQSPAHRTASLTEGGVFCFLNEQGTLAQNGWDDPNKSKLWRYNQHYFDDLNASNSIKRVKLHKDLINDWILVNSPGTGTGWEPYPTSLRIVNWIKWAMAGNQLEPIMLHSLAVQVRWLTCRLERHLLGNHLFANAKALVFAGIFFDGPEADRWLNMGKSILDQELPEQILSDGGQFELSPMYHALALEDLLDLVNIARTFRFNTLIETWSCRVHLMLRWLLAMTHPDGNLASFNDTAHGVSPSIKELLSYAERLDFSLPSPLPDLVHLTDSGYVRLTKGPATLIADVAPIGPDYLPGHAHADTLSFELSVNERRVIVNSGTSVYGLGPERIRQRGTAAHSTVTIDNQNSSEVWSSFRVGRRAYPLDILVGRDEEALIAMGAHDGYKHLPGAPLHYRQWKLKSTGLTITDSVASSRVHDVKVRFHLAHGYNAEIVDGGAVRITHEKGDARLLLTTVGATPLVEPSTLHPQFGLQVPSQVVCLDADEVIPVVVKTQLEWSY